jgi:hypothetical protein
MICDLTLLGLSSLFCFSRVDGRLTRRLILRDIFTIFTLEFSALSTSIELSTCSE